MYTIIICAIIGILVSIWITSLADSYYRDGFEYFFAGLMGLVIGAFSGMLVSLAFDNPYKVETSTKTLVSLSFDKSIEGSFFLGSGHIKEEPVYFFYLQNDDSAFYLEHVDCDRSFIKYSPGSPSVEIRTIEYENRWATPNQPKTQYVFNVPHGSIKNDFKLNP